MGRRRPLGGCSVESKDLGRGEELLHRGVTSLTRKVGMKITAAEREFYRDAGTGRGAIRARVNSA
jgi:hypothetical protein